MTQLGQGLGEAFANGNVTISTDGSLNIPLGQTFKINGSAHAHDSSEITFDYTGFASTNILDALLEVDAKVSAENLWNRVSTTLEPTTANDSVDIGTGIYTGARFVSEVAIGTAPYSCTSTTLNTNLNADLWDGYQFSDYLNQAVKTTSAVTFGSLYTNKIDIGQSLATTDFYVGRKAGAFDSVQFWSGTTYTDRTTEAKSTRGTSFTLLADNADYLYCGKAAQFTGIYIDLNTAAVGNTLTFQYSKGSGVWGTLTVTDGTSNFTADGRISFTPPGDWAVDTVNSVANLYWVRIGSSTSSSTDASAYIVVPAADDNNIFEVFGNLDDTNAAIGVDIKGYAILNNVGSSTNFLSAVTFSSTTAFSNAATISRNSIATTSTDGLVLQNTTDSVTGTRTQISPRIRFHGEVWDSTTSSNETHDFKLELVPVSGTIPYSYLQMGTSIDGEAYSNTMTVSDYGIGIGSVPSSTSYVNFSATLTPGSTYRGVNISPTFAPSTNVLSLTGLIGAINTLSSNAYNINNLVGANFRCSHMGYGNITNFVGGSFFAIQENIGTITRATGGSFGVECNADGVGSETCSIGTAYAGYFSCSLYDSALDAGKGSITNLYLNYIETPYKEANSLLTNAYGLYVADQNIASTLNYAIYTNAGLIHFGDDTIVDGLFTVKTDTTRSTIVSSPK